MQKFLNKLTTFGIALVICFAVFAGTGLPIADMGASAAVDYYASITATEGDELLGQVHDLITETHTHYTSYGDCSTPSLVKQTDPGSSSSYVMEFYSQADIASTWGSGAVGTWNKEHVWCKSLSGGLWKSISNSGRGGGADMHHIRPVESRLNSTRNNNKYGTVSNRDSKKVYYKNASGGIVAHGGYNESGVFEPLDNVKGDVARIVMYVYTHYNTYSNVGGTTNGSGSSGYFGTLNFTNIMAPTSESAAKELLLEWNESDPVDDIERTRNEAVYEIQGNRNPFIDHPEYAEAIWGDGSLVPPTPVLPELLAVTPSTLTLTVGAQQKLTVTVMPAAASAAVTWKSSNASVATVSADGTVKAVGEGTATITATSVENPAVQATAQVTVEKPAEELRALTVTPASAALKIGESRVFTVTATPATASAAVTWKSSSNSVATVSADGTVEAVGEGTATITATSVENPAVQATAQVTVEKPAEELRALTVTPASAALKIGESRVFTVTATPATASAAVTWKSSSTSVATVSADGTVEAVGEGIATITATSVENPAVQATAQVTVEKEVAGPDETKLLAFREAVGAIVTDGSLSETADSLLSAISAYRALSEEERALAADAVARMRAAIDAYNERVRALDEEAKRANGAAVESAGGLLG